MEGRKVKIGTDFSGVGAFDQALIRLGVDYETVHACDCCKYSRHTYLLNFGTPADMELLKTAEVKKIDDIYYRGFVNTKLNAPSEDELKFVDENEERVARMFSFYYPWNVYKREIPTESLDEYVTTPPCQSFSIAGKRLGTDDKRGILFFNSLEFIDKNRPKHFYFENVKGLLSDDKQDKKALYGRTFQEWINYLGGKSINGVPTIFPYEDSVPYHIYFTVLNAKEHGVPQNRERVFIVGIRDDEHADFCFPRPVPLKKRLRDVLEMEVDQKYFLSKKMVDWLFKHSEKSKEKGNGFKFETVDLDSTAKTINARCFKMGVDDNYVNVPELIQINDPVHSSERVFSDQGISPTLTTMQGGHRQPFIEISDYVEVSKEVRSDESKAKRRKTGTNDFRGKEIEFRKQEFINTITTSLTNDHYVKTDSKRIRKLTPTECFRVMDFNPDFKNENSDTQKYKQAGNSVVVKHFVDLYSKLNIK